MTPELLLILGLAIIFILPITTELNVGIVAFVVAFLAGGLLLDLSPGDVLAGFPDQMFILIVGITMLVAIAQSNGTIEWLVGRLMSLARGHLAFIPGLLFITSFIASSLGPGAAPVLFVIGAGFIKRYNLNPLLIAAMVIHGTQSGAYSPIAPYGIVIGQLATDTGIHYSATSLYLGVVGFHLALAVAVFYLLGGHQLRGQLIEAGADDETLEAGTPYLRYLTLAGFGALLLAVVVFKLHLGVTALVIAFGLLLASDRSTRSAAVQQVAWPIVLVITGVLTYVNMIQDAGAINWMASNVSEIGSPGAIALFLCLLVAIVTGIASTIGTIGMLVPLSAPFIVSGDLPGTGLLTAMAISAAVSDVSPFSTWGALFLATVASVVDRDKALRAQLIYTALVVSTLPALAWLLFVIL